MWTNLVQKIQALGQAAKSVVLFILAPIVVVVAGILYLLTKNKELKDENATLQSEKEITKDETKDEEATQQADNSVANYKSLLDLYRASQNKPKK